MTDVNELALNTIDIDNSIFFDQEKTAWDRLIEQIIQGNVIPVIGSEILVDGGDIHRTLVDLLARKFKVSGNPISFSELVYNHDFLRAVRDEKDCVYTFINQIFMSISLAPSSLLEDLLSIKQFPFVLTTSFTPIVENVMRKIWKDELHVMRFNNNPSENNDVSGDADMRKPTIYYMFGKVGAQAHRYVLTDTDMLDFCSSWLSDTNMRPRNLVNELKNKYLLMLGNNYSDWLFRFIWYSMRKNTTGIRNDGLYAYNEKIDNDLLGFLERNHTFMQKNPWQVVEQIKKRLADALQKREKTKFDQVENNVDVFISYSRADSSIAEKLYNYLTEKGIRVWYDKKNISAGGNFIDEIKKGVRTARYFVPIFTHHVIEEKNDSHVYRYEWDEAIQVGVSLGRTYIIPISEKDFDFYKAAVPERIQQHNAVFFNNEDDLSEIADKIVHIMNQK